MGYNKRLQALLTDGQTHLLKDGLKGLEKESLRLNSRGVIATSPHPAAFGSALTHPWITTDYSEALIELITPPFADVEDTIGFLEDIHRFVFSNLNDELLLATSMPIGLSGDESIPIAEYGHSNIGKMKHIYRKGLAYRYGRTMQSIAGVHFNYSVNEKLWPVLKKIDNNQSPLPRYISDGYFGVLRNVHRYGWLLIYLFGNSPAISKSFFSGREALADKFPELDRETLYRPHATSLRMSDIGYRNDNQTSLDISLNDIDDYVRDLESTMNHPYGPYEEIGLRIDGEYRQLSTNILQIENEYYSSIRPKQVALSGERPTIALRKRGVRYVELRALDLNCFSPTGVTIEELRFLETFVLFCLLTDSPLLHADEKAETNRNSLSTACCGRTPDFSLLRHGQTLSVQEWASEILDAMLEVANILDHGSDRALYAKSIEKHREALAHPEYTLSARVLREMMESKLSFSEYAIKLSKAHAVQWKGQPLSARQADSFRNEVDTSIRQQQQIEVSDLLSFEEYLQRYMAKR